MKRVSVLIIILLAAIMQSCTPTSLKDVESRYALLDATKIHYKTCGKGDKTIVFVHGFGCDMNAWEYQVKDLSKKYKLVFVDLPGYGQSDKPQVEYTLDYFAQSVKVVTDSLNIDKAIFVGHSLGTPVCRQIAFNYPEKVSALCDVDGVYCFYPTDTVYTEAYEASLNDFVGLFKGKDVRHNIIQFVKSLCTYTTPAKVYDYAMNIMPETSQKVAYSTMSNLIDKKYWTGQKISVPTLIFCTQNSDIPPDNYQKMEELYSDMHYIEFNDLGHFIMMEDPKMFNTELQRWIEK